MDLLAVALAVSFEGSLGAAGVLLLLAFVAFSRMNKDVRRARMFIMADRVHRFLGAFTFGILLLATVLILSTVGLPLGPAIAAVAIFFFLGSIVYGSLEMFVIVHPRPSKLLSIHRTPKGPAATNASRTPAAEEPAEGDAHAAR